MHNVETYRNTVESRKSGLARLASISCQSLWSSRSLLAFLSFLARRSIGARIAADARFARRSLLARWALRQQNAVLKVETTAPLSLSRRRRNTIQKCNRGRSFAAIICNIYRPTHLPFSYCTWHTLINARRMYSGTFTCSRYDPQRRACNATLSAVDARTHAIG